MTTAEEVKTVILSFVGSALAGNGVIASAMSDDTDLRAAGLIDSLGFVQLLAELETRLGAPIDLADLDPERLTNVGALSRHIAANRPRS